MSNEEFARILIIRGLEREDWSPWEKLKWTTWVLWATNPYLKFLPKPF